MKKPNLWVIEEVMVEVKRRDGESLESLLRRFTKRVQQSGLLIRARKSKFYQSPKTKREIKEEALRRKVIKARKEYLRKIGKLDDLQNQKFWKGGVKKLKKALPKIRKTI